MYALSQIKYHLGTFNCKGYHGIVSKWVHLSSVDVILNDCLCAINGHIKYKCIGLSQNIYMQQVTELQRLCSPGIFLCNKMPLNGYTSHIENKCTGILEYISRIHFTSHRVYQETLLSIFVCHSLKLYKHSFRNFNTGYCQAMATVTL